MARTCRRRYSRWILLKLTVLAVLITMAGYIMYLWTFRVSPNLEEIGALRTKALVSRIVNETVSEQFGKRMTAKNLLTAIADGEGNIEMVQSNTAAINSLVSELSVELQERYRQDESGSRSTVPLGSLFGSQILSQSGPDVEITVIPATVSEIDFVTEFETAGINQTKYKVYIVLNTEARVMAPFSTREIEVSNTILIAEAVILGKVPQSYVQVPKESVLDAT